MTTQHSTDDILDITEASAYVHVCVDTLRYYRCKGVGPHSFKIGRRVFYRKSALDAWIDQQEAGNDRGA